jgi:hypothetical protein
MTSRPVTHEEAKAIVDRLCSREEYSPDPVERLKLAAYVEQAPRDLMWMTSQRDVMNDKLNEYIDKTVAAERRAREAERERDELRAKLDGARGNIKQLNGALRSRPAQLENARLASIVRENGPHILRVLSEGYAEDRVGEECTECEAAQKALAEALSLTGDLDGK